MKTENAIYNKWMSSSDVPTHVKEEMETMTKEQIEASFSDAPLKFGTAGYRAPMGPGPLFLNEFTYQRLTVAYSKFVMKYFIPNKNKKPKILIAHDNRSNGRHFANHVAYILSATGFEAYLAPKNTMLATPMVSYIVRHENFDGAINITASHNPKEYNGFKAYNRHGAQVTEEEADEIISYLPDTYTNLQVRYAPNLKEVKYISEKSINQYLKDITIKLDINPQEKSNAPIIFTPHHGACCLHTVEYLKSLGNNIIPVESQRFPDSEFINSEAPNPEDPASFKESLKVAEQYNSDIMLGVDPDGDRLAVAIKHKGKWNYLNGNQTGILATNYILKYKNYGDLVPVVISTYVTNSLINKIVEDYNGLVLRTATGFKNIAIAMDHIDGTESEFIIGFEEAIGMCFSNSIREKDGIAAAALILQMYHFYKKQKLDLVDVLELQIYQRYGYWYGETVSINIPGNNWKDKATNLESNALKIKPGNFCGLKIEDVYWNESGSCIEWKLAGDAWIKFRISGTEPKFKIYYNLFFSQPKTLYYEEQKYKDIIKSLTKEIQKTLFK
ncbi:MAG: phospho-sugar mutase [Mycoplasma sp.]